jgi:DUF1707 SHOCT-like domain
MPPEEPPEDNVDDSAEDSAWADSSDRKTAIRALAEHRAEEHLSAAEHDRRRSMAERARTQAELLALFSDLPAPHPLIGDGAAVTWAAGVARAGSGAGLLLSTGGVIVLAALLAGWWVPALIFACLLVVATVFTTLGGR